MNHGLKPALARAGPGALRLTRREALAFAAAGVGGAAIAQTVPLAAAVDIRRELGGDGDITDILVRLARQGVERAHLAAGRYSVAPGTSIGNLVLEGAGEATNIVPAPGGKGNYLLEAAGSSLPLPGLARPAERGDKSVRLSVAPDCRPGDLIQIYDPRPASYSNLRPMYRAGEFALVEAVTGAVVRLSTSLRGRYQSGVRVARIVPTRAGLRNLHFAAGRFGAFRATYGRNLALSGVSCECAAPHGVYVDRCVNFRLDDCVINNRGSGSSSDYGLAIGNSQSGTVTGGRFFGRRHGIGLGGGDFEDGCPTGIITLSGCSLGNDLHAGTPTADIHGNCRDIVYSNCQIDHGATMGGTNARYVGCLIGAMQSGACVYGAEMLGGTFVVESCQLSTGADPSRGYRGIVDFGGNSVAIGPSALGPITVEILDTTVSARNQGPGSRIIEMRNRGSRYSVNLTVDGLTLDVDRVRSVVSLRDRGRSGWTGGLHIEHVSGRPPSARLSEFQAIP